MGEALLGNWSTPCQVLWDLSPWIVLQPLPGHHGGRVGGRWWAALTGNCAVPVPAQPCFCSLLSVPNLKGQLPRAHTAGVAQRNHPTYSHNMEL